jgi:TorA maturation chaperone TorD
VELFRALAVLAEPPVDQTARLADALELGGAPSVEDYTELFVFQLYPYASVHLGVDGRLGGEARDRIGGFWRAIGLVPPAEPDHLSALLGLYATVAERELDGTGDEDRARWRRVRHALLWEHLLSWLPPYLDRVQDLGAAQYVVWAASLREALAEEAHTLGGPVALPAHLRDAPALPSADAPADDWLTALLAPVRSGVLTTRADLARGARKLGLGLRAGERRFALRALLEQDANATLVWLASEARQAASRHAASALSGHGTIAGWWAARARATAAALEITRLKEHVHV